MVLHQEKVFAARWKFNFVKLDPLENVTRQPALSENGKRVPFTLHQNLLLETSSVYLPCPLQQQQFVRVKTVEKLIYLFKVIWAKINFTPQQVQLVRIDQANAMCHHHHPFYLCTGNYTLWWALSLKSSSSPSNAVQFGNLRQIKTTHSSKLNFKGSLE